MTLQSVGGEGNNLLLCAKGEVAAQRVASLRLAIDGEAAVLHRGVGLNTGVWICARDINGLEKSPMNLEPNLGICLVWFFPWLLAVILVHFIHLPISIFLICIWGLVKEFKFNTTITVDWDLECDGQTFVSNGPFYHGDPRLKLIEEHKWRFASTDQGCESFGEKKQDHACVLYKK